eukprot:2417314-Amphidinium_carterae.1
MSCTGAELVAVVGEQPAHEVEAIGQVPVDSVSAAPVDSVSAVVSGAPETEFTDSNGKKWTLRALQKAYSSWAKLQRKGDSAGLAEARSGFVAEYSTANQAKRVDLLVKWGRAGGPKASVSGLVEMTMCNKQTSNKSGATGYCTPARVAELDKLPLECYGGNLALWEASLSKHIKANQEMHQPDWPAGTEAVLKGHDFWSS